MKKLNLKRIGILLLGAFLLTGCAQNDTAAEDVQTEAVSEETLEFEEDTSSESLDADKESDEVSSDVLEDGVYYATFTTDSTMFHINEVYDDQGELTVSDGIMTIHITLPSKNVLNLYPGLAADAENDEANWLQPTIDAVTYDDGMTEEVHGFDVVVPYLDQEFDLALIGTKGKWYDHKVIVSDPVAKSDIEQDGETSEEVSEDQTERDEIAFDFEGGSGKAYIVSPAKMQTEDGQIVLTLEWSSPNYDYMIVDGVKYLPVNTSGNSVFEIPVKSLSEPLTVIGDTVAMSKPHEIEYTLTFHNND